MIQISNKIKFTLLSIVVITLGILCSNNLSKSEIISTGIDPWEYHSIAVNFAKYGEFPLMGVYKNDSNSIYQFNSFSNSEIEDYLFCRWYESGSVYSFEKPPLYPLVLGLLYKIFSININHVYFLNLFLLTISVYFIFLIGSKVYKCSSLFSFITAFLYLFVGTFNSLSDVSADLLLTFLVLLTINYILKGKDRTDFWFFFWLGMLFSLMAMAKGNIIFFVLLYPFFLLIQFGINITFLRVILIIYTSFFLFISPWIVYANIIRIYNTESSKVWGENLKRSEQKCKIEIQDHKKVEENHKHQLGIIQSNMHHRLVTHLWGAAYSQNKFIILSNQFRPEEFLSLHNEYCTNGEWKPEWRFMEDAYYNRTNLNEPMYLKIVYFYKDHPKLLFEIAFAKLKLAIGNKFSFYCLAMLLVGCSFLFATISDRKKTILFLIIITIFSVLYINGYIHLIILISILIFIFGIMNYRKKTINLIHYSFILLLINSLLFTVVLYGGERFIYFIDPISILLSLKVLENIYFRSTFKQDNYI